MNDRRIPHGLKAVTNSQVIGNGTEITIYGETEFEPGDCIRIVMGQTKSKVLLVEDTAGADHNVRIGADLQHLNAHEDTNRFKLRFILDGVNSSGESYKFFRVAVDPRSQ